MALNAAPVRLRRTHEASSCWPSGSSFPRSAPAAARTRARSATTNTATTGTARSGTGRRARPSGIVVFGVDRERQAREAAAGSGRGHERERLPLARHARHAVLHAAGLGRSLRRHHHHRLVFSPPGADGERFRAQAYVMGRQLRSDGVRVQVFRQVLTRGQWVDAPVSICDQLRARGQGPRARTRVAQPVRRSADLAAAPRPHAPLMDRAAARAGCVLAGPARTAGGSARLRPVAE